MPSGASPNLTRALELALQYLGFGGRKTPLVTQEPVTAVLENGDLVAGDAVLRTSGDVRAIAAGQTVPVLWSRANPAPGHHGAKPALVLRHHARKGQPGPVTRQLVGGIVEELFVAPISEADARLDVWFRNDRQITRLNIRDALGALDPDVVQWGQSSDAFLVRTWDIVSPPTYYVFRLLVGGADRDPAILVGPGVVTAVLDHTETWNQLTVATVRLVTGDLTGVDVVVNVGDTGNGYTPSMEENAISITGGTETRVIMLLDDDGGLAVGLIDAYLTAERHVLLSVNFDVTVRFDGTQGAILHRFKWNALPHGDPAGWEPIDSNLIATTDLLLNSGSCAHTALIDLTSQTVLWSSTGENLTVSLGGTFRRLWHPHYHVPMDPLSGFDEATGTAGPMLALRDEDLAAEGYPLPTGAPTITDPPPLNITVAGTLDIGEIGGTGLTLSPLHGLSFVTQPSVIEFPDDLRRDTVPDSFLNLPGLYPNIASYAPASPAPFYVVAQAVTGTLPDAHPAPDEPCDVLAVVGQVTLTGINEVHIDSLRVLHWDNTHPETSRIFLSLRLMATSASGVAAAFIVDGQGQLITQLLPWTAVTGPFQRASVGTGSRRHVVWGANLPAFSHPAVLTAIDREESVALASAPAAEFETAGARIVRPDHLYATAEAQRMFLTGWDATSGAVVVDPAHPVQRDARLAEKGALKDLPSPDPTERGVTPSYQVTGDT